MKFKNCRLALACIIFCSAVVSAGCKKSTGSDPASDGTTKQDEFFLTAKVDGKDWSANIKNGDYNVAGGTSDQYLTIIGAQASGTDSSAIVLLFPRNPAINVTKSFDPFQKSVAGYATAAGLYRADPAVNGSGTYSITSFNDSSKVIEGTFSFKAMLSVGTGNNSVDVTEGKFKAVYRDNFSPSVPSNVKQ